APGEQLDVNGTVRAVYFTGNGGGLTNITNGGGWSQLGGNVFTATLTNNVGIGTNAPQGGLVVTNGNVGIGTSVPQALLDISTRTGAGPVYESGIGNAYIQNDLEVGGTAYLVDATIGVLNVTSGLSLVGGST